MSNPRNIESYPSAVKDFVAEFSLTTKKIDGTFEEGIPVMEDLVVDFPHKGGAWDFRSKIYGYLNACMRTSDQLLHAQCKAFRRFYSMQVKRGQDQSHFILAPRGNDKTSLIVTEFLAKRNTQKMIKTLNLDGGEEQ